MGYGRLAAAVVAIVTVMWAPSADAQEWLDYRTLADSLLYEGNPDSAMTAANRSLELIEAEYGPHDTLAAKVLYRTTQIFMALGDVESALGEARRAVEIMAQNLPPGDLKQALYINLLAWVQYNAGQLEGAERSFFRVLAIYEAGLSPNDILIGEALYNLADLYLFLDRTEEAVPLLARAVTIFENSDGVSVDNKAAGFLQLGDLYMNQSRYADAEQQYRQAMKIISSDTVSHPQWQAEISHAMANLYSTYGHYGAADSLYASCVSAWREQNHPALCMALLNYGLNFFNLGDYRNAEYNFRDALDILESGGGLDSVALAQAFNTLGAAYWKLGRSDEALEFHRRALRILDNTVGREHSEVILTLNNIGYILAIEGQYDEAERYLAETLDLIGTMEHADPGMRSSALESLAQVYRSTRRYASADSLLQSAQLAAMKANGREHPAVAAILKSRARLNMDLGDTRAAQLLADSALAIDTVLLGSSHPEIAAILELEASCLRAADQVEAAASTAYRAWRIRQENFSNNVLVFAEREAMLYCALLRGSADLFLSCARDADSRSASGSVRLAEIVLASKGAVSDGVFRRRALLNASGDTLLAQTFHKYFAAKSAIAVRFVAGPESGRKHEFLRGVDSLRQIVGSIEADLARLVSAGAGAWSADIPVLAELTAQIPESTVVLEYFLFDGVDVRGQSTEQNYGALVLNRTGVKDIVWLGSAGPIDDLIDRYRYHLLRLAGRVEPPSAEDLNEYIELGRQLTDAVLSPVMEHLSDYHTVLVAPDGMLSLVSFAGLPLDDDRFLVERWNVHYLAAARNLLRRPTEATAGEGIIAMGDPDFDAAPPEVDHAPMESMTRSVVPPDCDFSLASVSLARLPGTRREVRQIAVAWEELFAGTADVYYGTAASEAAFKTDAPGKLVVHLATHGYFAPGGCFPINTLQAGDRSDGLLATNPLLLSGLFLSGAADRSERPSAVEDGVLTAEEVSLMDLSSARWVVLSACESGVGAVHSGEGIYGLRRAFQMAGARTIISALWPVQDAATASFMGRLYRDAERDLPAMMADIARRKIAALRRRGDPEHPLLWASFIAVGDWHGLAH